MPTKIFPKVTKITSTNNNATNIENHIILDNGLFLNLDTMKGAIKVAATVIVCSNP